MYQNPLVQQDMNSLGEYAKRDILQHAISAGVFAGRGLRLVRGQLSFAHGAVFLGDDQTTDLDEFPLDTVFECTVDNDIDGIWLSKRGAFGKVEVHLLQIKAGANGKTLLAGDNPRSTAGDATLASIKHRLIKAFVDLKSQLEAARVDTSRLKLASLHLLSTKKVCGS